VSQIEYVWHDIFTIQISVGDKILRSVLIYVFLIAMLRIVGKRELGQANTLDLVVLLLVANAVQNGIIGNDLSVTGAVIGAATLFVINELFSRATYLSPFASRLLEGEPTQLIEDGQLVKRLCAQPVSHSASSERSRAVRLCPPWRRAHRDSRDERRRDHVQGERATRLSPGRTGRSAHRQALALARLSAL